MFVYSAMLTHSDLTDELREVIHYDLLILKVVLTEPLISAVIMIFKALFLIASY